MRLLASTGTMRELRLQRDESVSWRMGWNDHDPRLFARRFTAVGGVKDE
jgi:hypothetical protein